MSVVIETTIGDITVDLFIEKRPRACLNFLKLCKLKYYNFNLFHTIQHGFIAQTGDPTGNGDGGQSVWSVIDNNIDNMEVETQVTNPPTDDKKRFFEAEYLPTIRHSMPGLLSMVSLGNNLIGSQWFITLGDDLTSLDGIHCVIGEIVEGHDVLRQLNDTICDGQYRPYQDVRITHTVILEDPYDNPRGFEEPTASPLPTVERLIGGRIGADERIDDTVGKNAQEIQEMIQEREARAQATILEIVGDLPDADIAPPENVLFVCKLNPVTTDNDLEIIFSRFGLVKSCEVIRDRMTGDSLQYAFVEFEDSKTCETAYFKMDNVLIDDRRIHVDFSQSVAKVQWKGKGRLTFNDDDGGDRLNFNDLKYNKGNLINKSNNYQQRRRPNTQNRYDQTKQNSRKRTKSRSKSPRRNSRRSRNDNEYEYDNGKRSSSDSFNDQQQQQRRGHRRHNDYDDKDKKIDEKYKNSLSSSSKSSKSKHFTDDREKRSNYSSKYKEDNHNRRYSRRSSDDDDEKNDYKRNKSNSSYSKFKYDDGKKSTSKSYDNKEKSIRNSTKDDDHHHYRDRSHHHHHHNDKYDKKQSYSK